MYRGVRILLNCGGVGKYEYMVALECWLSLKQEC